MSRDEAQMVCWQIVGAIQETKASGLTALDVRRHVDYADYFVICSGSSDRQVQAVAQHVLDTLKQGRRRVLGVEGLARGHWVLIDTGDVVVHVFYEPVRDVYDLEGLWCDAARLTLPEPRRAAMLEATAAP